MLQHTETAVQAGGESAKGGKGKGKGKGKGGKNGKGGKGDAPAAAAASTVSSGVKLEDVSACVDLAIACHWLRTLKQVHAFGSSTPHVHIVWSRDLLCSALRAITGTADQDNL